MDELDEFIEFVKKQPEETRISIYWLETFYARFKAMKKQQKDG